MRYKADNLLRIFATKIKYFEANMKYQTHCYIHELK